VFAGVKNFFFGMVKIQYFIQKPRLKATTLGNFRKNVDTYMKIQFIPFARLVEDEFDLSTPVPIAEYVNKKKPKRRPNWYELHLG